MATKSPESERTPSSVIRSVKQLVAKFSRRLFTDATTGAEDAESYVKLAKEQTPRIVVLGATGVGKSTLLNRLSRPMDQKRDQKGFAEGEGAISETRAPIEKLVDFLGDSSSPTLLVDMPGLDDSSGAEVDTKHLQSAAKFLGSCSSGQAHLFVLVVNGAQATLGRSVRDMLQSFAEVFDADGTRNFTDYLSVVFTRVNYNAIIYEDGDTDAEPRSPEQFQKALKQMQTELAAGWPELIAEVFPQKAVSYLKPAELAKMKAQTVQGLRSRFVFVDNTISPARAKKMANLYKYDVKSEFNCLYLWALHHLRTPFMLNDLQDSVSSKQAKLAKAKQEAEKKAAEALAKQKAAELKRQRELEEQQRKLKAQREAAARERERVRKEEERRARQRREEERRRLERQRELQRQEEQRRREQQQRIEQQRREQERLAEIAREREYRTQLQRQQEALRMQALYEQQMYQQQTYRSYDDGYSSYSSGSSSRHDGPRCIDGSLDMRCKANRGRSKYS